MKRTSTIAAFAAFALATITSASAWACGPGSHDGLLFSIVAFLSAFSFWFVGSLSLAVMARRWSLGFLGWLRAALGSFGAAAIGAAIGFWLSSGMELSSDTGVAVSISTPLLTSLAYVLWVRSGRFARYDEKVDE